MDWPYEIAERDHRIQNPTSEEKLLLLGDYLRLSPESRVLDIACGQAGPAIVLARAYGCRIAGIEIRAGFAEEGRRRVAAAGLERIVEITTGDASTTSFEPESVHAALCLGAAFVWGTIADAAAALVPAVRPGGFVAVGEPFWRQWPPPEGVDPEGYVSLEGTVDRFEQAGLALTGLIATSEDDWDRYESLHWRAIEEWLAANPADPDAEHIRREQERRRETHLATRRSLLGWAIFVGRKP
jgi:SAM-dependent methyltransferase